MNCTWLGPSREALALAVPSGGADWVTGQLPGWVAGTVPHSTWSG